MLEAESRRRFATARVAHLATVTPDGAAHVVPIAFALLDDATIVTAVDHKPKRTTALQRLANIAHEPRVAVLADHYDDDWTGLWWARADGVARVHDPGDAALRDRAGSALAARYEQYAERPPAGALIVVSVARWSGWTASGRRTGV